MSQENVEALNAAYEALRRHDLHAFLDYMHPEIEATAHVLEVEGEIYRGRDGMRKFIEEIWSVFPDWTPQVASARDLEHAVVAEIHSAGRAVESGVPVEVVVWQTVEFRDTARAMPQENVETVARVYTRWARGDFTAGVKLFEQNVMLVIDPAIPDGGGVFLGQDGVRAYMKDFLDAWESLTIEAESLQDAGDSVLVSVRQVGVGRGSGVPSEVGYFQLWTFRGSEVIRIDSVLDEEAALKAVGLRE
jgi:ketosteroid isomerase-like protein